MYDLTEKVAIVTGSNTGLGLECVRQLLSRKLTRVIISVRSVNKGEDAAAKLREIFPTATINIWPLDMASYDSVKVFVMKDENLPRIDIAILNAGMTNSMFKILPGTGHEETMQVNYLSTMLLSILLLPVLKGKLPDGPGRLTIATTMLSLTAKFAQRNEVPLVAAFDDEKFFDQVDLYPTSKFLGQVFLVEVDGLGEGR
ncbi:hypothetical protein N7532_003307 [Penicillium argentinense]|uniref:Uncharacterized protein n=1 Tax=Penicillium argentinense TaxID=1131581 RepID=A0A9W9KEJ1_9EURO|nr:uncharacterized protein N7532_003307 [Penicillium argentinense]KAJ5102778.1 hypothetical protein N7532_003307 [Penicillium argentinense]